MLGTLAGRGGENAEFSFSASPNVGRPEPPAIWIKSSIPVLNAAILILSVHFPLRPPQFSCLKAGHGHGPRRDRKSTRLNSSHQIISYAVFCLKKKKHIK